MANMSRHLHLIIAEFPTTMQISTITQIPSSSAILKTKYKALCEHDHRADGCDIKGNKNKQQQSKAIQKTKMKRIL